MTASIYQPGNDIPLVNANNTLKPENFTVVSFPTLTFTLTLFAYVPGTGSLQVYIRGVKQRIGIDYFENANGSSFTLAESPLIGDVVTAEGFVGITVGIPDAEYLRLQLANEVSPGSGSSLVGYRNHTVEEFLDAGEWELSDLVATYNSPNSFIVPGNVIADYHVGRRVQMMLLTGPVYGNIAVTVFTTSTLVTVQVDFGGVLDASLTMANLSVQRADHISLPSILNQSFEMSSASIIEAKGADVIAGALTDVFANTDGDIIDISGNGGPIINFGFGKRPGHTVRGTFLGTPTLTKSANLTLNTAASSIVIRAGDTYEARAISASVTQVIVTRATGTPNSLVGTVAQVGGVPTGAIIESGSNANGTYIKYADGTMIAHKAAAFTTPSVAVNTTYSGNVTLAASFVGTKTVSIGSVPNGSTDTYGIVSQFSFSDTVAGFIVRNGATTAQTFSIHYTAIGRWF